MHRRVVGKPRPGGSSRGYFNADDASLLKNKQRGRELRGYGTLQRLGELTMRSQPFPYFLLMCLAMMIFTNFGSTGTVNKISSFDSTLSSFEGRKLIESDEINEQGIQQVPQQVAQVPQPVPQKDSQNYSKESATLRVSTDAVGGSLPNLPKLPNHSNLMVSLKDHPHLNADKNTSQYPKSSHRRKKHHSASNSEHSKKKKKKEKKKSKPTFEFPDYMHDYFKLRREFDNIFPETQNAEQRRLDLVDELRKTDYHSLGNFVNDEMDCPLHPAEGYPKQWPIMDLIENWNPEDFRPNANIYQGICVFDYRKDYEKAINYRKANVPFVIRNDPEVLQTVERWNHPDYMRRLMGERPRTLEHSKSHHFLFYNVNKDWPKGWKPPSKLTKIPYDEWFKLADKPPEETGPNMDHWYYSVRACGPDKRCHSTEKDKAEFLFDEMPFFEPKESVYKVNPEEQGVITCHFGMTGVTGEAHYDFGENFVVLLGGERRYILASPDQCKNLGMFPTGHPSERHSAVDWGNPDERKFPEFKNAYGNEILLQPGDVLYIPTFWFHFIVNLGLNWQCNTRSGFADRYSDIIGECGQVH